MFNEVRDRVSIKVWRLKATAEGPFGVAALVVALALQAVAGGALEWWW